MSYIPNQLERTCCDGLCNQGRDCPMRSTPNIPLLDGTLNPVAWLIDEDTEHARVILGSAWQASKMGAYNKLLVTLMDAQEAIYQATKAERERNIFPSGLLGSKPASAEQPLTRGQRISVGVVAVAVVVLFAVAVFGVGYLAGSAHPILPKPARVMT